MDYITWNNSMSVNIAKIDNQHKNLITEINNFYEGIKTKKSKDVLSDILYQLNKYSIYHFQTEEALMKKYSFPGYKAHTAEHETFNNKIAELQTRLNAGKMVLPIEVATFLKEWLINHVMNTDKGYSKFLNDCGIK